MAQKFETKIVTVKLEDLLKVVPTFTKKSGEIVVNWSEIEERTTLAHAKTLAGWRTLADGRKQAVLNAIAPTGFSWIRADYGTCVAREEGAVIAGVTFDASCINPFTRMIPKVLMDIVMGSGVQLPVAYFDRNPVGRLVMPLDCARHDGSRDLHRRRRPGKGVRRAPRAPVAVVCPPLSSAGGGGSGVPRAPIRDAIGRAAVDALGD